MQQFIYGVVLLAFCGGLGLVAYENPYAQNVRVFEYRAQVNFSTLVGWVFILGIITGWVILAMLRNLIQRVSESED